LKLKSIKLLRVHSSISLFELVDVPDLQAEIDELFEDLKNTTLAPNFKSSPTSDLSQNQSSDFITFLDAKSSKSSTSSTSEIMVLTLKNAISQMNIVCQPQAGRYQFYLIIHATEITRYILTLGVLSPFDRAYRMRRKGSRAKERDQPISCFRLISEDLSALTFKCHARELSGFVSP
jgi:hypothetical protein